MKGSGITVGVFDSGIGGLTVLKECQLHLPNVRFLYYGDNFHAPYGEKSDEEIYRLTKRAVVRLRRLGADVVVLACNTVTAVCVKTLRKEFSFPIVGTEPAVLPARTCGGRILVLCTPKTAESDRLATLIGRTQAGVTVCACPHLARAVEDCFTNGAQVNLSRHLPRGEFDRVVLGCTHYVWLKKEIEKFYGVPVYDGNEGVARRVKSIVYENLGMIDHFKERERGCSGNKNKCLQKSGEKGWILGGNEPIFIGKARKINKNIYKQMFAL